MSARDEEDDAEAADRMAALRQRSLDVAAEGRRLAQKVAETEDHVARVHDEIATGPSSTAENAPDVAASAHAVAAKEREAASGGRLFRADPDVDDPAAS